MKILSIVAIFLSGFMATTFAGSSAFACDCEEYRGCRSDGYSASQCRDIADSSATTGSVFLAPGYKLLIDRGMLLLKAPEDSQFTAITLQVPGEYQTPFGTLTLNNIAQSEAAFTDDPHTEFVSLNLTAGKLQLRPWRDGDRFQPLGMSGSQKVQDYLTNARVSRFDKRNVLVLTSDDEIAWLVGYRISEKFRYDSKTSEVIRLKWSPKG